MTYSLTGKKVSQSYQKLVQIINGVYYDGIGNIINSGLTGFQGSQGNTGIQGWQGFQGVPGSFAGIGDTGFQGFQGNTGIQGWQGFQGVPGSFAGIGDTGFQGPQGNTGVQGWQGFQGVPGVIGDTGFQGFQGFQGNIGFQGFQGSTGPVGFFGTETQSSATYSIILTENPIQYLGVSYSSSSEIYLPDSIWDGKIVVIKDESYQSSINSITINGKIDSSTQSILSINGGSLTFIWRGGNWWII